METRTKVIIAVVIVLTILLLGGGGYALWYYVLREKKVKAVPVVVDIPETGETVEATAVVNENDEVEEVVDENTGETIMNKEEVKSDANVDYEVTKETDSETGLDAEIEVDDGDAIEVEMDPDIETPGSSADVEVDVEVDPSGEEFKESPNPTEMAQQASVEFKSTLLKELALEEKLHQEASKIGFKESMSMRRPVHIRRRY